MKRILLDCDGVLSDFCGGFLRLVNAHFGTMLTPNDVTSYDIAESLGWSRERAAEAYGLITDSPRFAADLEAFPGAVEGVSRLRELGDVYVVTSPWHTQPTWCHDRTNWLWRNFAVPAHHVVHTSAKHLIAGDVLVDDKLSHCEEWRARWGGLAVLWSTPHNRRDLWDGQSTSDWAFLVELIRSMPA